VGLEYQYSLKILKKYNDLAEAGITNLKEKASSIIEEKTFIK
jgi:hypothetical protein